ncbi:MAG: DUF2291 family protein [Bacteroidales bacterium]|nr:DUF2291 family protein [Bacteroidales bacterium]
MKKTIIYLVAALAALWFSFSTENLTQRRQREALNDLNADQLVEVMMQDSLAALSQRAVSLESLAAGCGDEAFARQHGRVLGIGSPTFYVVQGQLDQVQRVGDEIRGFCGGQAIVIPVKHVFGNTAREASGWFNIDDFQNTMDFNAVSAALNACIAAKLQQFSPATDGKVNYLGAVAVVDGRFPADNTLKVIAYDLNND